MVPAELLTAETKTRAAHNPKRPSITFAETVHVYSTTALHDYTDEEYRACWYSSEEYNKIEKEMLGQFKQLQDGCPFDAISCSRGLEQYLTVNASLKQSNKSKAQQIVLDEQDRQLEVEKNDENAISKAYQDVSSSCHLLWAAVLGHRDQQDAAQAYNDGDEDEILVAESSNSTLDKSLDGPEPLIPLLKVVVGVESPHGSRVALVSSQMLPLNMKYPFIGRRK
ncbi:unnamed protein product [Cylindrotheca closterium]|uniref:Uncharacterized protein n=1 Tax=Cylindrotheca closterium TaxID=2856 RepID=A0AAD2FI18_9STRA|nr:unnamed protein product [Cylindrotheca closterium]